MKNVEYFCQLFQQKEGGEDWHIFECGNFEGKNDFLSGAMADR